MTVLYVGTKKNVYLAAGAVVTIFTAGLLTGHFGIKSSGNVDVGGETIRREEVELERTILSALSEVESQTIRSFLQELAASPHLAGGPRDRQLAHWIKDTWRGFGLDSVSLQSYNFLLSYPDSENPNKIFLLDQAGEVKFTSKHQEDVLRPEDEHKNFIHAFNAFAPQGDVTGELVYVNYGRVEDIQRLVELGVNLQGKIAISRYGKIFRGNRLKNCQDAGAIGVIIYSDPEEVAGIGTDPGSVYPNTFFLPPSGVQRGSVFLGDGDPLSPTWTSVDGAYRLHLNDTELPKIPCQPIGYGDAERLLSVMGGEIVPQEWRGGIPGLTYRLGPGFDEAHTGWKVRLVVNNYIRDSKSENVIGLIRGSEEPDRFVIFGNHRDAWGYGAVDPSSGTAIMMEVARVLGARLSRGWRPRRSILLGSWAAEEAGIMGSAEWVYDKLHHLMNRAVGLVNIDAPLDGNILVPSASPGLKAVFVRAMKDVRSANDPRKTLFEFLTEYHRDKNSSAAGEEVDVKILGSGTDHASFAYYAGVPAAYHNFIIDRKKYPTSGAYPTYHTGYETFYLVDKILDPGFAISKSSAQLNLHILLQLSQSPLLPFRPSDIVGPLEAALQGGKFDSLKQIGLGESLEVMVESLTHFKSVVKSWTRELEDLLEAGGLEDRLRLRMKNDQLMMLERVFILPEGLPGRKNYRHALFSPSKFNSYGLTDLLHGIEKLGPEEKTVRVKALRKHLSDLMIIFRQAASWMENVNAL